MATKVGPPIPNDCDSLLFLFYKILCINEPKSSTLHSARIVL